MQKNIQKKAIYSICNLQELITILIISDNIVFLLKLQINHHLKSAFLFLDSMCLSKKMLRKIVFQRLAKAVKIIMQ